MNVLVIILFTSGIISWLIIIGDLFYKKRIKDRYIKNFILKNYTNYDYDFDSMFPEAVRKFKCSDKQFTDAYENLVYKNKLPKKYENWRNF